MQLDFATLSPLEAYRWLAASITPRPIAWVSTRSPSGVANLAPFSFFQVISDSPPT
ncbi:MAG: flavin reductase family protein, partial [Pseudomonas sp.]|nr:flavin reductase family protein [Pseudomonas sp.]